MAPLSTTQLSPAELSYLHTSLSQTPPIRPDGRTPTQFRPLVAETDILPSTNGSARICFADGSEAVVGVKCEVEKAGSSSGSWTWTGEEVGGEEAAAAAEAVQGGEEERIVAGKGQGSWVEVAIDIPGYRDDDALPVFLGAMLTEALLADGRLKDRLFINNRFHWRLYVDILLLSPPNSYPLPLLSLTTHLALLRTRLPSLISEKDEDPLFNDDWDASTPLYTSSSPPPPITLLVMSVASTIILDPSRDELAVADSVLALSLARQEDKNKELKIVAVRMIDPPSRLTNKGTAIAAAATAMPEGAAAIAATATTTATTKVDVGNDDEGSSNVWRAPRGGVRREIVRRMMKMVVQPGGVGDEVLEALAGVE